MVVVTQVCNPLAVLVDLGRSAAEAARAWCERATTVTSFGQLLPRLPRDGFGRDLHTPSIVLPPAIHGIACVRAGCISTSVTSTGTKSTSISTAIRHARPQSPAAWCTRSHIGLCPGYRRCSLPVSRLVVLRMHPTSPSSLPDAVVPFLTPCSVAGRRRSWPLGTSRSCRPCSCRSRGTAC